MGMNDYYVYTLAYPDGRVFYVGKGKGNRIKNHLDETRRGVQSPKCDIIRSILMSGDGKTLFYLGDGEAWKPEKPLPYDKISSSL